MKDDMDRLAAFMLKGGLSMPESVALFRDAYAIAALRNARGSITKAAVLTGMHRNTLLKLIKEHPRVAEELDVILASWGRKRRPGKDPREGEKTKWKQPKRIRA